MQKIESLRYLDEGDQNIASIGIILQISKRMGVSMCAKPDYRY
jgi:hypothetical protein